MATILSGTVDMNPLEGIGPRWYIRDNDGNLVPHPNPESLELKRFLHAEECLHKQDTMTSQELEKTLCEICKMFPSVVVCPHRGHVCYACMSPYELSVYERTRFIRMFGGWHDRPKHGSPLQERKV